jgi:hypothetical protein
MKSNAAVIATFCLFSSAPLFAQGAGQPPQGPPTETVAPDIPGVAGGTKVHAIKDGFQGTKGPSPSGREPHLHGNQREPDHQNRQGQQHLVLPREYERVERAGVRPRKGA